MLLRFAVKGIVLSVVAWAFVPLNAQDFSKTDIFAGYSFLRSQAQGAIFSTSGTQQRVQPVDGFNASVTENFNRWVGITGDVSGYYSDAGVKNHVMLAGPQLSFRKAHGITPYLHALFGASYQSATREPLIIEGAFGGPGVILPAFPVSSSTGLQGGHTSFAMAFGGGVDYNINPRFSIRLIQADYLRDRFSFKQGFAEDFCTGTTTVSCTPIPISSFTIEKHNNLRLSFGVVFHL